MALVMSAVYDGGFSKCCRALPLSPSSPSSSPFRFVATQGLPGPTMLLTFVVGVAADKVVERGVDPGVVLRSVGENLALFHSVNVGDARLRTYQEGGACLVFEHMSGKIAQKIEACEHTVDHEYHSFYIERVGQVCGC